MTNEITPPKLTLTRQGPRQYYAENPRGATISIGDGPGQWTPGDLLKLALAGCKAMSGDARLASELGEDFPMDAHVWGDFDKATNRYLALTVQLDVDLDSVDDDRKSALLRRTHGAIDRNCTIARTLETPPEMHTYLGTQE